MTVLVVKYCVGSHQSECSRDPWGHLVLLLGMTYSCSAGMVQDNRIRQDTLNNIGITFSKANYTPDFQKGSWGAF